VAGAQVGSPSPCAEDAHVSPRSQELLSLSRSHLTSRTSSTKCCLHSLAGCSPMTGHGAHLPSTETNRIHFVLFGTQNRTLGPLPAAIFRMLISVVCPSAPSTHSTSDTLVSGGGRHPRIRQTDGQTDRQRWGSAPTHPRHNHPITPVIPTHSTSDSQPIESCRANFSHPCPAVLLSWQSPVVLVLRVHPKNPEPTELAIACGCGGRQVLQLNAAGRHVAAAHDFHIIDVEAMANKWIDGNVYLRVGRRDPRDRQTGRQRTGHRIAAVCASY
jgi:hypothetical protein